MKRLLALLNKNKTELIITFSLLGVILSSVSLTYAWVSPFLDVYNQNNQPGQLDSNLSVQYWDKTSTDTNKWAVPASGSVIYGLGEMENIFQLPADSNVYIKLRMDDETIPFYQYQVVQESITINVSNADGVQTVTSVNYYTATPSQKCFDYYYVLDNDDLNPTTLFADLPSLTIHQFTTAEQLIVNEYIDQSQSLYLMMKPRLEEIQNIIRSIPLDYAPYGLNFALAFNGEIRTVDE